MEEKRLQLYRPEAYVTTAQADLPPDDLQLLTEYIVSGGLPLAPEAAAKFLSLFMNGSDAHEIARLNKPFKVAQILDAQVRYKWAEKREQYSIELQSRVPAKVLQTQLETTELITDVLAVANKRYGDKLKKYIQSGDEKDLDGVMNVESLKELLKLSEGLLKITGQDRVSKVNVKTHSTQNVNLNVTGAEGMSPEDSAQILAIVSASKRKANEPKT
jgi:hypothetical protein